MVSFKWRDRRDNNREKIMTLTAVEFIRRFLMHVLPSRFMKIRHYGFLSNVQKKQKLRLAQKLTGSAVMPFVRKDISIRDIMLRITGKDIYLCRHCGGNLQTIHSRASPTSANLISTISDSVCSWFFEQKPQGLFCHAWSRDWNILFHSSFGNIIYSCVTLYLFKAFLKNVNHQNRIGECASLSAVSCSTFSSTPRGWACCLYRAFFCALTRRKRYSLYEKWKPYPLTLMRTRLHSTWQLSCFLTFLIFCAITPENTQTQAQAIST